jgi:hypothetical protein
VSLQSIGEALTEAIDSLRGEVVRLRTEKRLLAPVFLNTRSSTGTVVERLRNAAEELSVRAAEVDRVASEIREHVDRDWDEILAKLWFRAPKCLRWLHADLA